RVRRGSFHFSRASRCCLSTLLSLGELHGPRPVRPKTMLDRYRKYLELLARVQTDRRLQGKIDLSGVVQQTLLEAHGMLPRFHAKSEEEIAAWLRRILANNLADEVRKLKTAKRDVR